MVASLADLFGTKPVVMLSVSPDGESIKFHAGIGRFGSARLALQRAARKLLIDILKGKRVTAFFAIKDDLIHAGADFVDEEVVVDGNLVTSRIPDDLPAFMRAVIANMAAR